MRLHGILCKLIIRSLISSFRVRMLLFSLSLFLYLSIFLYLFLFFSSRRNVGSRTTSGNVKYKHNFISWWLAWSKHSESNIKNGTTTESLLITFFRTFLKGKVLEWWYKCIYSSVSLFIFEVACFRVASRTSFLPLLKIHSERAISDEKVTKASRFDDFWNRWIILNDRCECRLLKNEKKNNPLVADYIRNVKKEILNRHGVGAKSIRAHDD